jgi:N6-adenosine-specific RNA methylase IME4
MSIKYDVIVSDPPWAYYGQQDKWGAAAKFYDTMDLDGIIEAGNLPEMLSDNGVLFLWATSPLLDVAMEAIERWGLHYRGIAFVWVKTKKNEPDVPIKAQGVRPSIVKPTTELVLAASRVKKGRPMKLHDESICQVILAPKREHSRKPDELFERIERMYPGATRLEMYARESREGWDNWGNQTELFDGEKL